tara:strand:+ start:4231 stop:4935 length:705 start_codon:yes stop_codon:yes gene_type:complete
MQNNNLSIYNFVSQEKLDRVNRPIHEANGLPSELYINNEYLNFERKKLFEDKWVVIGVASSLPNIGDAKPFDMLGIPLIILRDKNKKIKVFHNVCSHRGYKLLQKSCNIKNVLRCPYHSWAYDLDGNLSATPHLGGMNKHHDKNFDKSKSNLKEVLSVVWLDMILVNISGNAENFDTYIKPLSDRWEKFWPKHDQKLIKYAKDYNHFTLKAKCNWKFAIENYCESYHFLGYTQD